MTWTDFAGLVPVLILLGGAILILMAGAYRPHYRLFILAGISIALTACGVAVFSTSAVKEVSGIFRCGPYADFFMALWSLLGALTLGISFRYGEERKFAPGEYVALVLFSCVGMSFLSMASSLVGFFLGLEMISLNFYILTVFHRQSPEAPEAGMKYLLLGAVATGFLAFGIALIFAATGTLKLPEAMSGMVAGGQIVPLGLLAIAMFLVGVGFKLSLFPFHFWTPDVYQGAPAPVTGLLASGSKGAVWAAMVPLGAGLAGGLAEIVPLLKALALLTLATGVLCALVQDNIKRLLAFSSVSHMGYVLIAFLSGGLTGERAVIFYLVTYSIVVLGSFGVLACLSTPLGEPRALSDFKGLAYRSPFLAAALTIFLFSLAGIPLTAGFIGKFHIFYSAVRAGHTWMAIAGVIASLISMGYYLRLVFLVFQPRTDSPSPLAVCQPPGNIAVAFCSVLTLVIGIFPAPLLKFVAAILSP
ncbi:MAG: NADH-quinone oxidoreductase subunit N [Deltaproteobacteria bacterium]|nr:NADH-quinone oxidoreductase subunit N [Deltaproteobacteria bacterium]